MRTTFIFLTIAIVSSTSFTKEGDSTKAEGRNSQIFEVLKRGFQKRNPNIGHIELFDIRPLLLNPINYPEKPNHYLVVARGVRPDKRFQGNWDDELIGLFLFDDSLTTIERTVAFVPTQRWGDFVVKITRVWKDSVTIQGFDLENGPSSFSRRYYLLK